MCHVFAALLDVIVGVLNIYHLHWKHLMMVYYLIQ
jgi:hypothetical protein